MTSLENQQNLTLEQLNQEDHYIRLLFVLYSEGSQTFSTLVSHPVLKLSRNTVSKYLNQCRNSNWVKTDYQDDRKMNSITEEGMTELSTVLRKYDIFFYRQAISLHQSKIEQVRDEFITLYQVIPNQLMLDCIEIYLELIKNGIENNEITSNNPEMIIHLSFFIARFSLKWKRNAKFIRSQPKCFQFSQKDLIDYFKIDIDDICSLSKHYVRKIGGIHFYDGNDALWFLLFEVLEWELLELQIKQRTKRGMLQEVVFENFKFNLIDETTFILSELEKAFFLDLDNSLRTQLFQLIQRLFQVTTSKKLDKLDFHGNLPNDPDELNSLGQDYLQELNSMPQNDINRKSILLGLHYIYAKLDELEKSKIYAEKYLELAPNDQSIITILAMIYYRTKESQKLLSLWKKEKIDLGYNPLTELIVLDYFIDIGDLQSALAICIEGEQKMDFNGALSSFNLQISLKHLKILAQLKDWRSVHQIAIQLSKNFDGIEEEFYDIEVKALNNLEEWELLERFCQHIRNQNPYHKENLVNLYKVHIKRNSKHQADELFVHISNHYPELVTELF